MPLKEIVIWCLILAGPILAFIGMRRYHVQWTSKEGAMALIACAATVIGGAVLFWLR